jgi:hypothetical protein
MLIFFMNFFRVVIFIFIVNCSVAGCLFLPVKEQASREVLVGIPTGKIVNRPAIVKDGSVAVLPFKAGEGVSADPQLDRMSMMISKGIIDYLNEQHLSIKILTTQDQGMPDMMIDGYIESFKRPSKISRWFLRDKTSDINVSGQMTLLKNKERLIIFNHSKTMQDKKRDGMELAYQMGQDLGRFITDALKEQ